MFTGLIDHCGVIETIEPLATGLRLSIRSEFTELALGESIAVDGACLTVTTITGNHFTVELSQETLDLTIAGSYQPSRHVNLERALRMQDCLGGHFVSGHVDQVAIVDAIIPHDAFHEFHIHHIHSKNLCYLIPKGSISINGVSLTINKIFDGKISLMLIPHTLEKTSFSQLTLGDTVNIEFDLLAKMITQQLQAHNHATSV